MALILCPECKKEVSNEAGTCPHCGYPLKPQTAGFRRRFGFEWKSHAEIFGWPLIHVAIGRNPVTGKWLVAKGIIAIGQFGLGLVTIAQFGVGLLFGFGQFVAGTVTFGQFAFGLIFGLGQFATGMTAIGQMAYGKYVLAQIGVGEFVWSSKIKDPHAVEHFTSLWQSLKPFLSVWRTGHT